jgi:hypothetical protein
VIGFLAIVMELNDKIKYALQKTRILLEPRELLSSYDNTTVHYYMLTVPMYLEFEGRSPDSETVVREGKITWQKPKLLTPSYILRAEGFSQEAKRALEVLASEDSDLAMILYSLRMVRNSERMDIVSQPLRSVASRVSDDIKKKGDPHSAVISGIDEFWDVSLSKFIQEIIGKSVYLSQLPDFMGQSAIGLNRNGFPVVTRDHMGIPITARKEIELLFRLFEKGEVEPSKLKTELDRWGLFEHYQDRFLRYFRKN